MHFRRRERLRERAWKRRREPYRIAFGRGFLNREQFTSGALLGTNQTTDVRSQKRNAPHRRRLAGTKRRSLRRHRAELLFSTPSWRRFGHPGARQDKRFRSDDPPTIPFHL